MAFTSTITLNDGVEANQYVLTKMTGDASIRIDNETTLALPKNLFIRHSVSGKDKDAVDRHNVVLTMKTDATPVPVSQGMSVTLTVPRNSAALPADLELIIAEMIYFFSNADNVAALLRGES